METQFPIKHKILQNSRGFRIVLEKTRFPVEKHKNESGALQHSAKLPITVAMLAKSSYPQSSASEIENFPKVCKTFCLLEQKVLQAYHTCQTCQTYRFRNWEVNQTPIPSLPSVPFSELVPTKHSLVSIFV